MSEKNIKSFIDELIKEVEDELDEANVTGNVDGYDTPHAFSGKNSDKKRKKTATQFGYTLVNNDINNIDESINEDKVYIDFLNKKKGFKQDRIKFNSYEDAVKWAKKNFDKFDPDMIKYESVNEDAPIYKDWDEFVNPHYILVTLKNGKKLKIEKKNVKGGTNVYHAILKAFNDNNHKITNKVVSGMLDRLGESVNEASLQKGKTYGGSKCEGGCFIGKEGLKKIIKISKDSPKDVFMFRDDNYSGLQPHFIKDGVIAKATTINPAYDLEKNKVRSLNIDKDVILSVRLFVSTNESVNEALDPKAEKFLDAIQVNDRSIKDLKNITVDATPQGNWSVYYKGKRMFTLNGKMLDDKTIMKYGLEHMDESLSEGKKIQRPVNRWLELKNDESMHANKKLATGLRELKYQFKESVNEAAPLYKDWDEFVNPHYILVTLKNGKKLKIEKKNVKGGTNVYHAILKAFNDNNHNITNRVVSGMIDRLGASVNETTLNEDKVYIDFLNKKKGFKQDRIKFNSYEDAVKWAKKNFDKFNPDMIKYESVNEAQAKYDVYHNSYTSAIQSAKEYAEKQGYTINDDDSFTKIGLGPRKPSEGKTNRFSIELSKDGKVQRKMLQIQVYGMRNKYELNCYIG
jgi:hypothetical protein